MFTNRTPTGESYIFQPRPWIALVCMGLSYGMIGWHCAAFNAIWNVGSWLIAMAVTFVLIWGWKFLSRMLFFSPRILVTILILSMTLTTAVSFSTLFILMIMVIASTLFARLELQTAGISRFWTLIIVSIVSGMMIGGGWAVGHHLYRGNTFEFGLSLPMVR